MPLAVIGHPAPLHRNDAALHLSDRFPVVGGDKDGRTLHIDLAEEVEHFLAALRVKASRGLIGEQYLRLI